MLVPRLICAINYSSSSRPFTFHPFPRPYFVRYASKNLYLSFESNWSSVLYHIVDRRVPCGVSLLEPDPLLLQLQQCLHRFRSLWTYRTPTRSALSCNPMLHLHLLLRHSLSFGATCSAPSTVQINTVYYCTRWPCLCATVLAYTVHVDAHAHAHAHTAPAPSAAPAPEVNPFLALISNPPAAAQPAWPPMPPGPNGFIPVR